MIRLALVAGALSAAAPTAAHADERPPAAVDGTQASRRPAETRALAPAGAPPDALDVRLDDELRDLD